MASKLLVFGGNGFLGRRICQEAVNRGMEVVSISRSGKPPVLKSSPKDKHWISEVRWESADILNPSTYYRHLQGASGVVHSLGILLEDESYKKRLRQEHVSSRSSSYSWASWLPSVGSNPLIKRDPNFTYEVMNKRTATVLAKALEETIERGSIDRENLPTFTYISADKGFPIIPEGYINSKRETEENLLRCKNIFRPIIMRPGFLFDEMKGSQNARTYIHHLLEFLNVGNKVVLNNKFECINGLIRPTVSTQQVSRCVLSKISDPKFEGVVSLETIREA